MDEISQSQESFSRRAFLSFLIAGIVLFLLWCFRRVDPAAALQKYFGFDGNHLALIHKRFLYLKHRNPVLYRDSVLFFSLQTFRSGNLLHKKLRQRVLANWIGFLFNNRAISWPYAGYPVVGEFQICNGLIREQPVAKS